MFQVVTPTGLEASEEWLGHPGAQKYGPSWDGPQVDISVLKE